MKNYLSCIWDITTDMLAGLMAAICIALIPALISLLVSYFFRTSNYFIPLLYGIFSIIFTLVVLFELYRMAMIFIYLPHKWQVSPEKVIIALKNFKLQKEKNVHKWGAEKFQSWLTKKQHTSNFTGRAL